MIYVIQQKSPLKTLEWAFLSRLGDDVMLLCSGLWYARSLVAGFRCCRSFAFAPGQGKVFVRMTTDVVHQTGQLGAGFYKVVVQ